MTKRPHATKAATLLLCAALAFSTVFCAPGAYADDKTIYDYDQEIVAKQIEVDRMQREMESCRAHVNELTADIYKHSSTSDAISWILGCDSFEDFVTSIDFLNRMRSNYLEKGAELQRRIGNLKSAQVDIERLRLAKEAQIRRLEEAKLAHYSQGDERWANMYYYGGNMAWTGCGLCAYSSVIDVLTGNHIDPPEMLEMRGDWVGMDHYPDSSVGTPDGSTHAELTSRLFDLDCRSISKEELLDAVADENGAAVVLLQGQVKRNSGEWWYTSGHYVCAYSFENGQLHIQDPAGDGEQGRDVVYEGEDLDTFLASVEAVVLYHTR